MTGAAQDPPRHDGQLFLPAFSGGVFDRCWAAVGWLGLVFLLATRGAGAGAVIGRKKEPAWQTFSAEYRTYAGLRSTWLHTIDDFRPWCWREVVFPAGGLPVELLLPVGKGQQLKASFDGKTLWVDGNLNGRVDGGERRAVDQGGLVGPFEVPLAYDDGTSSRYAFCFQAVPEIPHAGEPQKPAEKNRFYLRPWCLKVVDLSRGTQMSLLDADGNGRYDDFGIDVVRISGRPDTFVGKKVLSPAGKLWELVVRPAGNTVEIREYQGEVGQVELFENFAFPQKAQLMCTVVLEGEQSYFAFDALRPRASLPEGTYRLHFAALARAKERVALLRGDSPSFRVQKGQVAAPSWGGKIQLKFKVKVLQEKVRLEEFAFVGQGEEHYLPLTLADIRMRVKLCRVKDYRSKPDELTGVGNENVWPDSAGRILPYEFTPRRAGEYEAQASYTSGILGRVYAETRFQFDRPPP